MNNSEITYQAELINTFNCDANYSGVKIFQIIVPDYLGKKTIKKVAKKLAGLSGIRGKWSSGSKTLEFIPSSNRIILSITWE